MKASYGWLRKYSESLTRTAKLEVDPNISQQNMLVLCNG